MPGNHSRNKRAKYLDLNFLVMSVVKKSKGQRALNPLYCLSQCVDSRLLSVSVVCGIPDSGTDTGSGYGDLVGGRPAGKCLLDFVSNPGS